MPPTDASDYRALVSQAILAHGTFLRAAFSAPRPERREPWHRVTARPVLIRSQPAVQFAFFDAKRCVTRNARGPELAQRIQEVLGLSFTVIHVQSTDADLHVRITRKNRALVTRGRPSQDVRVPDTAHDRAKAYPLAPGRPSPLLAALDMANDRGEIRPAMQAKFRQVNEFLRLLEPLVEPADAGVSLDIVDCGCGSAYLTFAAYHYLNDILGRPARLTGVDANPELVAKCCRLRDRLGWRGLEFRACAISGYAPPSPPAMVLSLHACDTATDEAIARGVQWGSRAILAVPCCQHELHGRLRCEPMDALSRHGILRERLADLVTDAFRAAALRALGYRTDVIEFVSPEHTARNIMIRARKTGDPGDPDAVREYLLLRSFGNVTPAIEDLLGDALRRHLPG